jgi:hypothetical protein
MYRSASMNASARKTEDRVNFLSYRQAGRHKGAHHNWAFVVLLKLSN